MVYIQLLHRLGGSGYEFHYLVGPHSTDFTDLPRCKYLALTSQTLLSPYNLEIGIIQINREKIIKYTGIL